MSNNTISPPVTIRENILILILTFMRKYSIIQIGDMNIFS
nr:MAG TPA_asm: hypothetical protein [Caudoviricetes sp.]